MLPRIFHVRQLGRILDALRAVGEIFGFLFPRKVPVSFEQAVETIARGASR